MTTLVKKAFDEISKLPQREQEAIVALILDEIASEQKWDGLFAKSQDKLSQLADEALEEFKRGKTKPLYL